MIIPQATDQSHSKQDHPFKFFVLQSTGGDEHIAFYRDDFTKRLGVYNIYDGSSCLNDITFYKELNQLLTILRADGHGALLFAKEGDYEQRQDIITYSKERMARASQNKKTAKAFAKSMFRKIDNYIKRRYHK